MDKLMDKWCPVLTGAGDELVGCLREECMWWVDEGDERYSNCAMQRIYYETRQVFFELREGGGY